GTMVSHYRIEKRIGVPSRFGDTVVTFKKALRRYDGSRITIKTVKAHYWLGIAYEEVWLERQSYRAVRNLPRYLERS
ncbi:MAG: hypothetical protein ACE5D6_00510, partial [Candidatus Zixiibacteriota bacterium]